MTRGHVRYRKVHTAHSQDSFSRLWHCYSVLEVKLEFMFYGPMEDVGTARRLCSPFCNLCKQ